MTLDVFFRESEPYYSEGVSTPPFQGKNSSEGNMLQKDGEGDVVLELEKVNEKLGRSGRQSLEGSHEVLGHFENESKLPTNTELPMLTALTEESIRNDDP